MEYVPPYIYRLFLGGDLSNFSLVGVKKVFCHSQKDSEVCVFEQLSDYFRLDEKKLDKMPLKNSLYI